jgi:hypothetical protein
LHGRPAALIIYAMPLPRYLTVEVITFAPVAFFHCMHCESIWQHTDVRVRDREQLATSLPEDLTLQYQQLSDWVRTMGETHGARVRFRIIDAVSVEGWMKSLRYGVRRYPAVIVGGKEKSVGTEFGRATEIIERRLGGVGT